MLRRSAGLIVLTVGCSSANSVTEVPKSDITLEAPLAPSALAPLGVTESVGGSFGEGARAIRGVTSLVAACVRPVVEREPWLRGSISFRVARVTQQRASVARCGPPPSLMQVTTTRSAS